MIYEQNLNFEISKEELYKRLIVYFRINNYRIRRAGHDTIIVENTLPYTLQRHPIRFISYFEIRLEEVGGKAQMYLKADYDNLRKFIRRIFRLALFVAVLPMLFLIVKLAILFNSYGESTFQVWGILLMNFFIGLSTLGMVWIFSKKKFRNLQKLMVFGSQKNPDLHQKVCNYFKELFQ